MVSIVAAERSKLHAHYPELRLLIIGHYRTMVELTGRNVDGKTYKLPPRLGHWGPQHSAKVRTACPELEHVVRKIEVLRARQSAEAIAAAHVKSGKYNRASWAKVCREQNAKDIADLKKL